MLEVGEAICGPPGNGTKLHTEWFLAVLLPAGKTTEEADLGALPAKLHLSIPSVVFQ